MKDLDNTPVGTPVYDFVTRCIQSGMSRLHMPGHKGIGPLGIEARDITEIKGADVLSDPCGIIAESEENAAALFQSAGTYYVTEGSSQAIKAMVMLALSLKKGSGGGPASHGPSSHGPASFETGSHARPVILAARNAHRAFLSALALLDADAAWVYPSNTSSLPDSVCACSPTPGQIKEALESFTAAGTLPAAVYITSPDYLGTQADIAGIAAVSHSFGLPLLVDNAHGAYLHFLEPPCHPLDLGADLCCDSAHKTLSALTGGAYLHVGRDALPEIKDLRPAAIRRALALFGSTSPSWLTLQSLDLVNKSLSEDGPKQIRITARRVSGLKEYLRLLGFPVLDSDPLKLTVDASVLGSGAGKETAPQTKTNAGERLAGFLRASGIEPEYVDVNYVVLMFTPSNTQLDYQRIRDCFLRSSGSLRPNDRDIPAGLAAGSSDTPESGPAPGAPSLYLKPLRQAMTIREAVFAPQEEIDVRESAGRILGGLTVSCPPAVPIAVCGEELTEEVIPVFLANSISRVSVVTVQPPRSHASQGQP